MYFKHPELLYALLLLVIPILVHLFQLRRFRTTKFTNVRFLKKAVLQTRKSSRLKKFLVLCTRMLLLTCVIFAFSQPYLPSPSGALNTSKTIIWLDNSYSMQAKGKKGLLLKRSIQDLMEHLPQEESFSLFTNDGEFKDLSSSAIKEKIQALPYSTSEMPWHAIELKVQNHFRNSPEVLKNFIAISDFQHLQDSVAAVAPDITTHLVALRPEQTGNLSVDTAYVDTRTLDETTLNVEVSATGEVPEDVFIGLYDGEELVARKTISLDRSAKGRTSFTFPSRAIPEGRLVTEDFGMAFDNELFFSINQNPPVQVVAIGTEEGGFLQRIYTSPEFIFNNYPVDNIDFNMLSQADLVILNEPETIPFSLVSNLQQLLKEQVYLIVIPSLNTELEEYNRLFQALDLPQYGSANQQEKLITDIQFEHPIYRGVFHDRVRNFEYPKVQRFFSVGHSRGILNLENGQPFLFQDRNVFVFTASISRENSNFKSAPLIVPTFYNIANLAISPPELYHVLGEPQKLSVQAHLNKDEILKLSSSESDIIPQQRSFQNKVELLLQDIPGDLGHFQVKQDTTTLQTLSFNIDRRESKLQMTSLKQTEGVKVFSSISEALSTVKSAGEVQSLWKWFVIFALFFLLIEMLILKFLK